MPSHAKAHVSINALKIHGLIYIYTYIHTHEEEGANEIIEQSRALLTHTCKSLLRTCAHHDILRARAETDTEADTNRQTQTYLYREKLEYDEVSGKRTAR
jgi:hypothetical protein